MTEKAKTPRIRFKGFADAWEQRKLGDVCQIRTGFPFDSSKFDYNGKYLVITNGNIQDESYYVDFNNGNRIDISDENILRNYLLNIGDILVTMDGTVGRTAKVTVKGLILAQRVGRLTEPYNYEFLYQALNSGSFAKDMEMISHGGTVKHVSLGEIGEYSLTVTINSEERKFIGALFENLDNLITLHQRKHDELKL